MAVAVSLLDLVMIARLMVLAAGDAPMDCGTLEGFKRIYEAATAVIKAAPLQTTQSFCNANLSQFTVTGVIRAGNETIVPKIDEQISVFAESDTPGLFKVPTDQGSVLLMLHAPSQFSTDTTCGAYPDKTFALKDCGWARPMNNLSADELSIVGTSVCGTPSDACMNDENWMHCRALHDGGCNSILVQESCPVKFACSDMCCKAIPSCPAGLSESNVPCCPGEDGCSVKTMCCSAVYCRQSTSTACVEQSVVTPAYAFFRGPNLVLPFLLLATQL